MLILWSGGLDSTYLLRTKLYEQYSREHSKVDFSKLDRDVSNVRAITINHGNVPAMAEQLQAMEKLKEFFKKDGLPSFQHTIANVNSDGAGPYVGSQGPGGLGQPCLWLIAAHYLLEHEDLLVGYVRGDDIWPVWYKMVEAFNAMQAIKGCTGKLSAPLDLYHKWEIIKDMKHYKLLDKVWWCENPQNGKQCKKHCTSCRRHATALLVMEKHLDTDNPPSVTRSKKRP